MEIGFIGLGNMGLNMVKNLLDHNNKVVVWNRSEEARIDAQKAGAVPVKEIKDIPASLSDKKVIFSMISAGTIIDDILFNNGENSIINILQSGDIFIDGANSFYKDSIRRNNKLKEKGILMLDLGISGGINGARNGACIMIGGDKEAYNYIEPILKDLSQENGYGYFGESGSGHFIKMTHNAIEYGMMEAIAEGLNLINSSEFSTDITKLLKVWNSGSIIEGKLIEFLHDGIKNNPNLDSLDTEVGSLGTGMWASKDALERGIPFTSITHAVFNRYQSRRNGDFAFKIIQAMRAQFGGHNSKERENK